MTLICTHDVVSSAGECQHCGTWLTTRSAASRQGAPRQAEDEDATWRVIHVDTVLAELGIRVTVGTLVPTGPAVRLDVDDTARWLEPDEAHALASALNEAATFAVHEDRAARRG